MTEQPQTIGSVSLGGSVSSVGLLTIAFVVLKLTGVISWSWLWVLSPLWLGTLAGAAFLLVFFVAVLIIAAATSGKTRHRRR